MKPEPTDFMTGAELKTLRESMNLSAQALADLLQHAGLLKANNERTVRRWEDGTRGVPGVPVDVATFVEGLNQEVENMAMGYRAQLIQTAPPPVFLRYETAEDWELHFGSQRPHAFRLDCAALGRLMQMARRENIPPPRIVSWHMEE